MGRALRVDYAGAWHHVWNRGARRNKIFLDNKDRRIFLALLDSTSKRYGVEVHSYCLLGNHYHLVLRSPTGELSKAMQFLGSQYTRRFNDRHGFDGPLCRSRFGSRLITDDADLLGASRYVHRNSLDVAAHIPLALYEWSSFGTYSADRPRELRCLETADILNLAGGRSAYRRLVEGGSLTHGSPGSPIDIDAAPSRHYPTLKDVDAAIANEFSCDPAGPEAWESHPQARLVGLLVGLETSVLPAWDVRAHFGFATASTARSALTRLRAQVALDEILAEKVRRVRIASGADPPVDKAIAS